MQAKLALLSAHRVDSLFKNTLSVVKLRWLKKNSSNHQKGRGLLNQLCTLTISPAATLIGHISSTNLHLVFATSRHSKRLLKPKNSNVGIVRWSTWRDSFAR